MCWEVGMRRQRRVSGRRICYALAAAAFFPGVVGATEITSTWSGNTGNWTDPTQWSTNPNYPNNGTPSGTDYDAVRLALQLLSVLGLLLIVIVELAAAAAAVA
jgi:hypothetical protein